MSEKCKGCPRRFETENFKYPTIRPRNSEDIDTCQGVVTVLRGFIASRQPHDNEPIPSNAISTFGGALVFYDPVWREEVACGQDEIKPGENEDYFDRQRPFELDDNGNPYYVIVGYDDPRSLVLLDGILGLRPHTHEPRGDDLTE